VDEALSDRVLADVFGVAAERTADGAVVARRRL